jgi:glycosyltransferase involved in cell wall biosynthesis
MMNDTHAGTARARGLKALVKRRIVASFDSGFVAGKPQRRYFASLGLPNERIFTGYDVVDNDFFARQATSARNQADEMRKRYNLPERYFLSLGRFVVKKNLPVLIRAFRKFLEANTIGETHLVMVGSGEEDARLRALCSELDLPVYEKSNSNGTGNWSERLRTGVKSLKPGVHFYGFRQISENPDFYALADAFILPSLYEEWGLVVNEAMACGLPVVVSETAGCAEDLLEQAASASITHHPPIELQAEGIQRKAHSNGFVFDPQSCDELAAAMVLLNANPDMRERMGKASNRIIEKFSCDVFAENALLAARAAMDGRTGGSQN